MGLGLGLVHEGAPERRGREAARALVQAHEAPADDVGNLVRVRVRVRARVRARARVEG